ncbi:uncharacterized protein TNCV_2822771 [Trichonephila clavipes]|nr:uncharacterized protein TNCV_2822771 [Trichonephila clavipes]
MKYFLRVEFKALTHLMILIPAKMNSPEHDDFIDMFIVPTLVSPFPPTPVASPSHEPSQEGIYDSLPPMEQSRFPESPLKDLFLVVLSHQLFLNHLRERQNEERRNEERRPRDPRLHRRPDFRPPYQRPDFKLKVFRRPPYAHHLIPSSQENAQIFFHSQEDSSRCFTSVASRPASRMDQIDAFHEHISKTVVPVTLLEKPDALEYAARQGQVRACIIYQEPNTKQAKHVNEFRPDDVLWEKISKGLLRNPDRPLKNTDKRMVYIYNNMFFVKKDFTFGFRSVKSREIPLIQTTNVPMLIYEFPSSSLRCRANPNLFRKSFESFDQILYHRIVLEPHTAYPIPAGTRYILLTVQKTVFGLDIITKTLLPQLIENGFNLGDFRKMKRYDQKAYKLPPPTLAHVPAETNKRPLEKQPGPSSKRPSTTLASPQPVIIPELQPPVHIPPVQIQPTPELTTPQPPAQISVTPELTTPQPPPQILLPDPPQPPVRILDPPVQIPVTPDLTTPVFQPPAYPPVQLLLPDPPQPPVQILLLDPPNQLTPMVETLEPTLTDVSSIDQIMPSVFGNYSQQGI